MVKEEMEDAELFADEKTTMMGRAYGAVSMQDVIERQDHLNDDMKKQLKDVLDKYTTLFDGKLGSYERQKFRIHLKEGTEPVYLCPFPIPYQHKRVYT